MDAIWVDEARVVPRWSGPDGAFETLRRRLRGSKPGSQIGMWITTHSPTQDQAGFFEGASRNPDAKLYRWSSMDALRCGTLPRSYEEILRAYKPGTVAHTRIVLGQHALPEGRVYEDFDPNVHVKPAPPRSRWTRVTYGVDWGWTHPTAVMVLAWCGNTVHVVGEWSESHASIRDVKKAIATLQAEHGTGVAYCGADQPRHIQELMEPDEHVPTYEPMMAEAYKGREEDGVAIANDRFRGGELTIDAQCVKLIQCLVDHARKPNGDPEDEGEDEADAFRYGLMGGLQAPEREGTW